jgi:hypothetical protein
MAFPPDLHTGVVRTVFCRFTSFWPDFHRTIMTDGGFLKSGDATHNVVKGQAEHLDVELNGVALPAGGRQNP